MKYKSALFWGGLIAVAGVVTFQTSYEVQELEEKLGSLNRKIMAEQEAIQILKAEWSYLNDPMRLENLSRQHLALQPTEARQFVAMDVVPMRPVPVPEVEPAPSLIPKPSVIPAPLPPMASNPAKPAAGAIIPASATPARPAPIKPSAIIPASAKVPALPAQAPAAAPVVKAPPPPVVTTKPTDIAARPSAAPKPLTAPAARQPQPASNTVPPQHDSIGVLVARLGANR
ncbi:cell division protein FtsL [Azospirillum soli]|uniref:cell division protein FtsL n=1 Tax=Azospirillum soli TaxID=1304799 RepID=UPI001AE30FF6|nr:hypothetical protein [Azospirillum soli]MBP2315282.1 hypothetical protein [Azospirillum soli]